MIVSFDKRIELFDRRCSANQVGLVQNKVSILEGCRSVPQINSPICRWCVDAVADHDVTGVVPVGGVEFHHVSESRGVPAGKERWLREIRVSAKKLGDGFVVHRSSIGAVGTHVIEVTRGTYVIAGKQRFEVDAAWHAVLSLKIEKAAGLAQ